VSLRSPFMQPRLAVVDPELTRSMPPSVTATAGLDALTQLVEPYVSISANPVTDALCREGMARAARSLRQAYRDGGEAAPREEMALANAKLGAVHGLAGPLGGLLPAPHGAICARLLPLVMDANVRGLQARAPDSPALARYDEVARLLTGNVDAVALDGVQWTQALCSDLSVPPLSRFGLREADIETVIDQGQKAGSMKGNSLPMTDQELAGILARAL
jgi:alcohol dehydrogenase class IV